MMTGQLSEKDKTGWGDLIFSKSVAALSSFQQSFRTWRAGVIDPTSRACLHIRCDYVSTQNGFHRKGELLVCGRYPDGRSFADQLIFERDQFLSLGHSSGHQTEAGFQVGRSRFQERSLVGELMTRNLSVAWALEWEPEPGQGPESLLTKWAPFSRGQHFIVSKSHQRVRGEITLSGEKMTFDRAPGYLSFSAGKRNFSNLVLVYASNLQDDRGEKSDLQLWAHSGPLFQFPWGRDTRWNGVRTLVKWKGKNYAMTGVWDSIRSRSESKIDQWSFQCQQGALRFEGTVKGDLHGAVGMTRSNSDGATLHSVVNPSAEITVVITRLGKLEARLTSNQQVYFETMGPEKSPYVQYLPS